VKKAHDRFYSKKKRHQGPTNRPDEHVTFESRQGPKTAENMWDIKRRNQKSSNKGRAGKKRYERGTVGRAG